MFGRPVAHHQIEAVGSEWQMPGEPDHTMIYPRVLFDVRVRVYANNGPHFALKIDWSDFSGTCAEVQDSELGTQAFSDERRKLRSAIHPVWTAVVKALGQNLYRAVHCPCPSSVLTTEATSFCSLRPCSKSFASIRKRNQNVCRKKKTTPSFPSKKP